MESFLDVTCAQAYTGSKDKIENVQKYFTRRLLGASSQTGCPYKQRLIILKLETLEIRRLKADLSMVFKIVRTDLNLIGIRDFALRFTKNLSSRRGHPYKLFLPRCNTNIRQNCFFIRTVSIWNSLPLEAVGASSLMQFKKALDNINFDQWLRFQ